MFRKKNITILLFFAVVFACIPVQAQRTSVTATIEPSQIKIGEHAVITLNIKTPKGREIQSPQYNYTDTLVPGIEVLAKLIPQPGDTVISHEVMTIIERYIVTSFDSALYNIPYMYVIDGEDTIKSKNLGLKVISPVLSDSTMSYLRMMDAGETDSINFERLQLNDIKDIQSPPFVLSDYVKSMIQDNPMLFWTIVILIIILAAGIIALFFVLRKKKKGYYFKPEIILPPHVVALQALDKIKSEKKYQRGLEKQYYTELTDALRNYIEKRYYIHAMEQTSDETLEAVHNFVEDETTYNNLKQILKLSDLVKFAKYKPLIDENDLTLMNAYLFIEKTKEETPPPVSEEMKNPAQVKDAEMVQNQMSENRTESDTDKK